jgi:hypothetical protein
VSVTPTTSGSISFIQFFVLTNDAPANLTGAAKARLIFFADDAGGAEPGSEIARTDIDTVVTDTGASIFAFGILEVQASLNTMVPVSAGTTFWLGMQYYPIQTDPEVYWASIGTGPSVFSFSGSAIAWVSETNTPHYIRLFGPEAILATE